MYGVGPSVANVTANGEEIVSVTEVGLSRECVYNYSNKKMVAVQINEDKFIEITISVIGMQDYNEDIIWSCNCSDLTKEEKEKFFTDKEKELIIQDAIRRYEADHRKPKGKTCSML